MVYDTLLVLLGTIADGQLVQRPGFSGGGGSRMPQRTHSTLAAAKTAAMKATKGGYARANLDTYPLVLRWDLTSKKTFARNRGEPTGLRTHVEIIAAEQTRITRTLLLHWAYWSGHPHEPQPRPVSKALVISQSRNLEGNGPPSHRRLSAISVGGFVPITTKIPLSQAHRSSSSGRSLVSITRYRKRGPLLHYRDRS